MSLFYTKSSQVHTPKHTLTYAHTLTHIHHLSGAVQMVVSMDTGSKSMTMKTVINYLSPLYHPSFNSQQEISRVHLHLGIYCIFSLQLWHRNLSQLFCLPGKCQERSLSCRGLMISDDDYLLYWTSVRIQPPRHLSFPPRLWHRAGGHLHCLVAAESSPASTPLPGALHPHPHSDHCPHPGRVQGHVVR